MFGQNRALWLALVLVSVSSHTFAAKRLHPPEDIAAAAEDFLRAYSFESTYPVEFNLNPLSSRLRLNYCSDPLEIAFSPNAKHFGKTHLRASCPSGKKWKINIGVELKVFQDVVLMKHSISRGAIIDQKDLLIKKIPRSKIFTDFYSYKNDIVGLVTTMPVRAEQIISSRLVNAANLVSKGQAVILIARTGGINITSRGKALNSALRGELVRVQNKDSGRIVEGIAIDLGKVEIPL